MRLVRSPMRRGHPLAALIAFLLFWALFTPPMAVQALPAEDHAVGHQRLTAALSARLLRTGDRTPVPVIIRFTERLDDLDWTSVERQVGGKIQPTHRFPAINGVAARLPAPAIFALATASWVEVVEYDEPVQISMANATHWFGTKQGRSDFGLSGAGVTVAVVDTGIDGSHVDFAGRIAGWYDFVGGQSTPYDDNGHGSHVAGIAAGSGSGNASYTGVAPGSRLVGLKAMDSKGSGSSSNVIAAVQWAIDHRAAYEIRVINLSLGTSSSSDGKDSISAIVNKAAESGILPVVSAGNRGPVPYTIGAPAAAAQALTVGSMADPGRSGFFLTDYSSRGPTADGRVKPDVVAPGYLITSVRANSGNGYTTMNGTSMASPFVAGLAALIYQANPGLTPAQVKSVIMATAHDWGAAGVDNEYGAGRLDGYAAIEQAVMLAGGSAGSGGPVVPAHQAYSGQLSGTGQRQEYSVEITDKSFPIAATLITTSWSGPGNPNLAIELYDPAGTLLGTSVQDARQDMLSRTPQATGTYKVAVISQAGAGSYRLDLSGGLGAAAPVPPETAPSEAPVVTIRSPANGSQLSGAVEVSAAVDAPGGTSGVKWAWSGGPWQSMTYDATTGLWKASWQTTDLPNGSYTVTVTATDSAGQTGSSDVTVLVENPVAPPESWDSGNLTSRWSVSGPGDFQRDYSFTAPEFSPHSAVISVRFSVYKADGSTATDGLPPYLEIWMLQDGAEVALAGTIRPTGTGTYTVAVSDAAALGALKGSGVLRLKLLSLDKKNGKLVDKVTIDQLRIQTEYGQ